MSTTNSTNPARFAPPRPEGGYKVLKQTPELTFDANRPLSAEEKEELEEWKLIWEYEQQLSK